MTELLSNLKVKGMGFATERLHTLLFIFLKEFIKSDEYNGQVRHLLKLFLEAIRPVIYHFTQLNDHTFYLTIMETLLKSRVPKDKYDLKNMAKLLLLEP